MAKHALALLIVYYGALGLVTTYAVHRLHLVKLRRRYTSLRLHLAAQLIGDAETFDRSEACDELAPVFVFDPAHRAPVASKELVGP